MCFVNARGNFSYCLHCRVSTLATTGPESIVGGVFALRGWIPRNPSTKITLTKGRTDIPSLKKEDPQELHGTGEFHKQN